MYLLLRKTMKKVVPVTIFVGLLLLPFAVLYGHLCDNVFRQKDALIVKPETYSLVVKNRTSFKIFLQNNMDRGIAEISLIPESAAFDFAVTPAKMSIPKGEQVYFQVTLTPKTEIRTGNYPVKFRLVGGGREFKSFTLEGLAQEQAGGNVDTSRLPQAGLVLSPAPVMDGNLNDVCWRNAAILSNFRSQAGPEPAYKTWVLMTFDRSNLYLGIMGKDESTHNLSPEDCIEIILSPGRPDSSGFFMAFYPAGTPRYKRYDKQIYEWNPHGIRCETVRRENDWSMEISVPLSEIETKYPSEKSLWNVRFTRIKESGTKETSFWAMDTTGYHSEKGLGKIVITP